MSVGAGNSDKIYYVLHKLSSIVRKVSPTTGSLIFDLFKNKQASRVGKRKWDKRLIMEATENNGGGGGKEKKNVKSLKVIMKKHMTR